MSNSTQTKDSSLPAINQLREEFMADGKGAREFPARFEIKLGNTHLAPDSTDDNPKVHPDFKKLFLFGNQYDEDSSDGFVNYKRQVDPKVTEFLVLRWRAWIEGNYDKQEKRYTSFSEEVDAGQPFVIKDVDGNELYRGGFDVETFKRLGVHLRTVLWVMPVDNGKIVNQVYRWVVKGNERETFNGSRRDIQEAQRSGVFKTLKIESIESYKTPNGATYAQIFFNVGQTLNFDEAITVWGEFKKNFETLKDSKDFVFKRSLPSADESEVEVVSSGKKPGKSEVFMSKKELGETKSAKVKEEADREVPSDLPWEKPEVEEASSEDYDNLGK